MNTPTMATIVQELLQKLNAVDLTTFEDSDASRQRLALAARELFHKLETKEEKTMRLAIEEPIMFSVLQALIDVGLWDAWTAVGGEKHVEDLAAIAKKGVDPELLREH